MTLTKGKRKPPSTEPAPVLVYFKASVTPEGEPFVEMLLNSERAFQCTPSQARELASKLFTQAEAAESDALLKRLLTDNLGMSILAAAKHVLTMRASRIQMYDANYKEPNATVAGA